MQTVRNSSTSVVDLHGRWERQRQRLVSRLNALYDLAGDVPEIERLDEQQYKLFRRIIETPARTPVGLAEQLEVIIDFHNGGGTPCDDMIAVLKAAADCFRSIDGEGRA